MGQILRDVWSRDRRGFITVSVFTVLASLTGGISIALLVPMLGILEISDGAESALRFLVSPLQGLPESTQMIMIVCVYFLLIAAKAFLNRAKSVYQGDFLENYACGLREQLYQTVLCAKWEQLAAGRQADTVNLFTAQCGQVVQGVSVMLQLMSSMVSALVSLVIAAWLSLPVTVFVLICGVFFSLLYRKLINS